jgi:hypothetical protein
MASTTSSGSPTKKKVTIPDLNTRSTGRYGDGTNPKQIAYPKGETPVAKTGKTGTATQRPATALQGPPQKVVGAGSGGASAKPAAPPAITPLASPALGSGPTGSAVAGQGQPIGTPPSSSLSQGDRFGGFAGRYAPSGVGNLYQNPQIVANDVLSSMGYGGNVGLQSQLGDIAQIAPALSFLMTAGGGASAQGDEDLINMMGAILRQQGTPGGEAIDYRSMLGNILGSGPNDLIYNYAARDANGNPLSAGDQSSALKGLLSAAMANVNPFAQRAMMGMAGSALTDYQGQAARGMTQGASNTALDYLRSKGLLDQFT